MPSWLPIGLTALVLVLVSRQAARPVADPDTFWHIALGDLVVSSGMDAPDRWATVGGQDWVLTQWLPEVLAAGVEDRWGLPGVAWLYGAGLVLLAIAVHALCRQQAGLTAAGFATALGVVGMSASLSPRPHMVTYILLTVTVGAWLRSAHDVRPRWWLIPLTWVWACSHGMWFTGVLVGLVVVVGLWLDGTASRRQLGLLALVPTLSLAVAALTPVGPRLLLAPFAVSGVSQFIAEWQPPSFRELGPAMTAAMVVVVAASWARRREPVPWTNLLLLGLAAAWMLLAARTVTLAAVITVPFVAGTVQGWLGYTREPRTNRERLSLAAVGCACLAVLAIVTPKSSVEPGSVPVALDAELRSLPQGTVVLNSYEIGGWLRWRHPSLQPVVDGMTEAYSTDHLLAYGRAVSVAGGWQDVVRGWNASIAVLPEGSPLASALEDQAGGRLVVQGNGYVMLALPDFG